tara:strand:+ start:4138 stop:4776 length:639 start_codon:yes stop_codon:yes gene_type:complete
MKAIIHQLALGKMANFVYIIEDCATQYCAIVDPAWDVPAILDCIKTKALTLQFILLTHGHFDHTDGIAECLAYKDVPVYLSNQELSSLTPNNDALKKTYDADQLKLGETIITIFHTPGHSPGGQCFYLKPHLITGDTLFINGCGRCDLGGSSLNQMYNSLEKIKSFPSDTIIYPGHQYDDKITDTLKNQKQTNRFLTCSSLKEFTRKRGGNP